MLLLRDVYNYDFETRSFVSAFFRAFLPIYRYLYSEVYPENKNSGRILDVGCGCGEYMLNLKKLEWQVYGVDSNKKAVINAKTNYGLDVFCGEVLNSSFPDNFFDAVTMHAVLEHISEPIDALKEVHRILKERGELIISVPNIWNWERTFFGKFWWAWDIPRHLWHFSPTSLKRLLKKAGFGDIKIRHKADMYDFPGNMKNMLKDIFPQHAFLNVLGEKDKLRFITKYLMMPIGVISALLGVSEQFVIFARK